MVVQRVSWMADLKVAKKDDPMAGPKVYWKVDLRELLTGK